MRNQVTFVLLALCSLLAVAMCQDRQVYCGRRLATTLAFLCDDTPLVKRADSRAQGSGWPWISAHRARSLARSKRQIVSECCDKPCTIDELLTYC